MNLTRPLPEGIYLKDKFYRLNTDFKIWLKIDEIIQSDIANEEEKLAFIISLAYPSSFPENINDALSGVLDFYSMYKKGSKKSTHKIYSFEKDAPFIFSAFRSQYGIDLFNTDMHWWKFKSLFDSIDENTTFGKIVRYRAINIDDIKDKNKKSFIAKMKRLYSLDEEADIANALFAL